MHYTILFAYFFFVFEIMNYREIFRIIYYSFDKSKIENIKYYNSHINFYNPKY